MTFSIVGYDPRNGDLGVAVASKFLAVGAVVPYARAKVGAIATQAFANASFGPRGLELLAEGYSAHEVVNLLIKEDDIPDGRQLAVIDARGNVEVFTGKKCIEWKGHKIGKYCSAQGNILAGPQVVDAMVEAFETTKGELVDKLLAALESGEMAGGDRRGKQSAAIIVVREGGGFLGYSDRYVDIRVDDHPDPIKELRRIFEIWDNIFLHRLGSREIVLQPARDIMELQKMLAKLGFYEGEVDGFPSRELEQAVKRYQKAKGLMESGYIDKTLIKRIKEEAEAIK